MNHYDVVTLTCPLGDSEGFLLLNGKVLKHFNCVSGFYIKQILDVLGIRYEYFEEDFKATVFNPMELSTEDMDRYAREVNTLWIKFDKRREEILNGKFRNS